MTFEVEDGSGSSTANSYESLDNFRAHHTDRNIGTSKYNDTKVNAALIKATDYVDKRFGKKFRGFRQRKDQALEWPRLDAFDNDGYVLSGTEDDVPRQLKKAISEYALLVLQLERDLAPVPQPEFPILDPDTGTVTAAGSGSVVGKREKVGPIEDETKYSNSQTLQQQSVPKGSSLVANIPEYPQADLWLEELLRPINSRDIVRG